MKHPIGTIVSLMVDHERGVPERVHHFLKVYAFSKVIGESEGLDEREQEIIQIAALMHDIGIRPSLAKYGSSAGVYQEQEGPALARTKLTELGYDSQLIERVCFLIAHHHTYGEQRDRDLQILIEADFLVNALEEKMSREAIERARERIFRTARGTAYLQAMFL